ncbi:hypothetical protein U1Q18_034229 [Sarracenia purpurea var. burkii]
MMIGERSRDRDLHITDGSARSAKGLPYFEQFKWSYPIRSRSIFRIRIGVHLLDLNLVTDPITIQELNKFSNNKLYDHCSDLSQLSSYLHWTYDSAASSLSVAFITTPAKSDGWISWAINPAGTGMVGAQAPIAFKDSKGAMTVKTYNISSYRLIVKGKVVTSGTD